MDTFQGLLHIFIAIEIPPLPHKHTDENTKKIGKIIPEIFIIVWQPKQILGFHPAPTVKVFFSVDSIPLGPPKHIYAG